MKYFLIPRSTLRSQKPKGEEVKRARVGNFLKKAVTRKVKVGGEDNTEGELRFCVYFFDCLMFVHV